MLASYPTCWAQSNDSPEQDRIQNQTAIDGAHATMSKGVLATANWIDSFCDDSRIESEDTRTRFKVTFTAFSEEGELIGFDIKPRLKLVLPRFEDRLQLIVSGDPDDDFSNENAPDRDIREEIGEKEDNGVTTTLQYFLKETRRRNISFQTGLRISGFAPVLFLGPRYRQTIDLDPWALRFTQRLRWFTDKGWDSNTRIDLERPLLGRFFFRTSTEGIWTQDKSGYSYNLRFLLFQPLSEQRTLSYEWNNLFQTEPNNQLNETNLRLRYRQRLWRDWLFFEIAPQAAFLKERSFKISPGMIFRLEVIFGYYRQGQERQ